MFVALRGAAGWALAAPLGLRTDVPSGVRTGVLTGMHLLASPRSPSPTQRRTLLIRPPPLVDALVSPNACAQAAGLVLSAIFPDDIIALYAYSSVIVAIFAVSALIVVGFCVKERPAACSGQGNGVPAVVAIRRALNNRPYLIYLLMKVPMTLMSLVPVNMLPYFVRYGMLMESWTTTFFAVQVRRLSQVETIHIAVLPLGCASAWTPHRPSGQQTPPHLLQVVVLVSSVLGTPLIWFLTKRFGKREVLLYASAIGSPCFLALFFVPPPTMPTASKSRHYIFRTNY